MKGLLCGAALVLGTSCQPTLPAASSHADLDPATHEEPLVRAAAAREPAARLTGQAPPVVPGDPEEPLELSVEQAVLLALRNNRNLRMQQLEPVIAGAFEQIERGAFDPQVFGASAVRSERSSETARATGERFDVNAQSATTQLGVRQRLSTGTTLEATLEHEFDESNRTPEQQGARLGLNITQSLLRGLRPAVNLARIDQAAFGRRASLEQLRGYVAAAAAETELSYWRFVLASQQIAIFRSSLQIAREQAREVAARIEVGSLPENAAALAQAEVARRRQALIDGRSALEAERIRLARLINGRPDERLSQRIEATSPAQLEARPIEDLTARLALAERMRPDLAEARLRLEERRLETVVTAHGLLPRLDLFVALGKTGFAGSFGAAFSDLGGKNFDLAAGLSFDAFVPARGARATHLVARAEQRRAAEAVENLRQQIRLEVRLAVNEAERARQQIGVTRVARELQAQALLTEQELFKVGKGTSLAVAVAQRDLLASEIAEVQAVLSYRQALVQLYLAEGSLLARRGIRVAGPPKS